MVAALTRAFFSLLHPRMLLLMIWPVLVSLALWLGLAFAFGAQAAQWLDAQLAASDLVQWMIQFGVLAFLAAHLSTVLLAIAFVPLVLVTAVLILGVFAMPAMVAHVARRDYPGLERRRGGSFAGSAWNSLAALGVFLLLAVVTLPLWLLPLLWPVLPVALFAYLNQRVFRYDALAEHASGEEMKQVFGRHRGELALLGVAVAVVGHVPILGLFSPVYGGLVFIHFCLDRLQALRASRHAVPPVSRP
jgi:hypothetical protein